MKVTIDIGSLLMGLGAGIAMVVACQGGPGTAEAGEISTTASSTDDSGGVVPTMDMEGPEQPTPIWDPSCDQWEYAVLGWNANEDAVDLQARFDGARSTAPAGIKPVSFGTGLDENVLFVRCAN